MTVIILVSICITLSLFILRIQLGLRHEVRRTRKSLQAEMKLTRGAITGEISSERDKAKQGIVRVVKSE